MGLEGANEHLVDGTKEDLFQCHVNSNVFLEEGGGFGECVSNGGGSGARGVGGNHGLRSRIGWGDERNGGECVVNGVGHGEGQMAESSIAKVGLDRGGVGVNFFMDLCNGFIGWFAHDGRNDGEWENERVVGRRRHGGKVRKAHERPKAGLGGEVDRKLTRSSDN